MLSPMHPTMPERLQLSLALTFMFIGLLYVVPQIVQVRIKLEGRLD
jgi:hypothetical protein